MITNCAVTHVSCYSFFSTYTRSYFRPGRENHEVLERLFINNYFEANLFSILLPIHILKASRAESALLAFKMWIGRLLTFLYQPGSSSSTVFLHHKEQTLHDWNY